MNNQLTKELMHSMIEGEYLSHHGIIGQKWGIRRFQPYGKGYSGDGKFVGKKPSIVSRVAGVKMARSYATDVNWRERNQKIRDARRKKNESEIGKEEYKAIKKEAKKEFKQNKKYIKSDLFRVDALKNRSGNKASNISGTYAKVAYKDNPHYSIKRVARIANKIINAAMSVRGIGAVAVAAPQVMKFVASANLPISLGARIMLTPLSGLAVAGGAYGVYRADKGIRNAIVNRVQ